MGSIAQLFRTTNWGWMMEILLPLSVLICLLLIFATPTSARSALDAAHIGKAGRAPGQVTQKLIKTT